VYWSAVASAFALDGVNLQLPRAAELPPGAGALWMKLRDRLAHKRVAAVSTPLERELRRRLPALTDAGDPVADPG
jgi:hypothetical protein